MMSLCKLLYNLKHDVDIKRSGRYLSRVLTEFNKFRLNLVYFIIVLYWRSTPLRLNIPSQLLIS